MCNPRSSSKTCATQIQSCTYMSDAPLYREATHKGGKRDKEEGGQRRGERVVCAAFAPSGKGLPPPGGCRILGGLARTTSRKKTAPPRI